MLIKDAIKTMLKDSNKTQAWLAERLGYTSGNAISNKIQRSDLRLSDLCRMCDELGYEVTVQPRRRAGARPVGQIVIDGK